MNYVYIDESGEMGRKSRYIIFASIATSRHRPVEKAIKKIWRAKPHLHSQGELHANSVDDATRNRVLLTLNDLEISVRYLVVDKSKHKQSLQIVYYQELARFISSHKNSHIVVVDKKDTNKKRAEMIKKLRLHDVFKNVLFEESYKVKQLQAVDFVAWSIGRFYEQDDQAFMDLIKGRIK